MRRRREEEEQAPLLKKNSSPILLTLKKVPWFNIPNSYHFLKGGLGRRRKRHAGIIMSCMGLTGIIMTGIAPHEPG
jgi:hypothetical protein